MAGDTLYNQLHLLSHNVCIYYSRLTDDIYQHLMDKALAAGYKGLKLSHAMILPQISAEGSRIIDIARSQAVSKQAIGQVANELEQLGFIEKTTDATDKRSKKLILTDKGITLVRLSAGFMNEVDKEIAQLMGQDPFDQLKQLSQLLFKKLKLKYPDVGQYTPEINRELPLVVFVSSISARLDLMLKEITGKQGHPPLKRSYWHVLEKITHKGIRINDLAEMNGISKQAVSQLANDIEKAGYICRMDDPSDKRSKQLILTDKGRLLVTHTLTATHDVENMLEQHLGEERFRSLKENLRHYAQSSQQQGSLRDIESDIKEALHAVIKNHANGDNSAWLITDDNNHYRLSDAALAALKDMRFS